MTHHEVRVLEDGTRKYSNHTKYKPIPLEERKYRIKKPDDPRAVRFGTNWFLPLEVLSDAERTMPETRPDDQTLEHRAICKCKVCKRPAAQYYWDQRRLRPGEAPRGPVSRRQ